MDSNQTIRRAHVAPEIEATELGQSGEVKNRAAVSEQRWRIGVPFGKACLSSFTSWSPAWRLTGGTKFGRKVAIDSFITRRNEALSVAGKASVEVPRGTLNSVLKQAGLKQ